MKLKAWKVKIKLFNSSWIMAFIENLHIIIILAIKVNSSGILTCSLLCIILFYFSFRVYIFSKSFDASFRNFTLFFHILLFSNMGKQVAESKVCKYLQDYQSQFKIYEPSYYRTLIVAPHGDGISWWNVENFKISSLWTLTVLALELFFELSFIHNYDIISFKA